MKNNKKYSLIIIIICLIVLFGLLIFESTDNKNKKLNTTTTTTSSNTTTTTSNRTTTKVKMTTTKQVSSLTPTEQSLLNKLNRQIIALDNTFGTYDNVTINDTNNTNFILFNIKQYLLENNIDYRKNFKCGKEFDEHAGYVIDKDTINKYIQEKYNTTNVYDIKSNDYINFEGIDVILSTKDQYILNCVPKSGGEQEIIKKTSKIEQIDNNIYVYEKVLMCHGFEGIKCYKENNFQNVVFDSNDIEFESYLTFEDVANYVFSNFENKTDTYKHTFVKASDGNYYWHNTELIK